MGYGAQYFRHTAVQLINTVLVGVLFYLMRVVMYHALSPEEYGLFYSVFSFGIVAYPILSFGFDPGIVPFVTRYREEGEVGTIKHAILGSAAVQVIVGGAFLLAVFLFAEPLAVMCFQAPGAAFLVQLVALQTVFLIGHKVFFNLLLGLRHVAARNLAEFVRAAVCLSATALLLRQGHKCEAAAWGYLLGALSALFVEISAVTLMDRPIVRAAWRWQPKLIAEVFRSGKYASIAFGGIVLFSNMDTLMLTLLLPEYKRPVAAYQIAVPTMMIVHAFLVAGTANFMPMATILWCRDLRIQLADGISRIVEAAFAVILPGCVLLAVFSDVLMAVLFRRDLMNAPLIFGILVVGGVFLFIATLGIHLLTGVGRPRAACGVVGLGLLVNLVLNVICIHWWEAAGAAVATVASYGIAALLAFASMRRSLDLRLPFKPVFGSFLASALVMIAAYWIRQTDLFMRHPCAVAIVAGFCLFALVVVFLECFAGVRLRALARIMFSSIPVADSPPAKE